ncbi:hypothetical protein PFISCL1PPCAC_17342, partial [Pristionchus fissidentatus]
LMDESTEAVKSTVAKVDNRVRLKDSLTQITYHEDGQNSRFVVDRFKHNHQMSMGEPLPARGGHVLFPEEATYLVEIMQGLVRTTDGRQMTLEELFMVLGDFSVPQQVYSAYSACKRAGFVVVRPGILEQTPVSPATVSTPADTVRPQFRVLPRALLDAFPEKGKDTSRLRVARPDLFPEGCKFVKQSEASSAAAAAEEPKSGKKRKEPPSIRPRAWPSLAYASKNAADWREYAELRRTILGKSRYSSPLDRCHFLLYSGKGYTHSGRRSGKIRPVARVAVYDFYTGRQCSAYPPCREDSERRFNDDLTTVPLLKAYVTLPRVSFMQESGAPIDLASIKKRLSKSQ